MWAYVEGHFYIGHLSPSSCPEPHGEKLLRAPHFALTSCAFINSSSHWDGLKGTLEFRLPSYLDPQLPKITTAPLHASLPSHLPGGSAVVGGGSCHTVK